jgi:aminoglycoside 6'-N-acetyltransferase I
MSVERATRRTLLAWHDMRAKLWPGYPLEGPHELASRLKRGDYLVLIARNGAHEPAGFAEAAIRGDFVNGCESSPVVFLEGIYVEPAARRNGLAREMNDAVAAWGREKGCSEYASDALLANTESHAMHAALGFEETERVVYFRKPL